MKIGIRSVCILLILLLQGSQANESERERSKPYIDSTLTGKVTTSTQKHDDEKKGSNLFGITVEDGKIILDTKQTKRYLHSIGEKLKLGLDRIEHSLRKGKIKSSNETGISVTQTTLHIDLNKTRDFMEKWAQAMGSVVRELNKTMSEIDKSLPKK